MIPTPVQMAGVPGSPYSRKLRAVLRYRRIPYAWVATGSPEHRTMPRPRVDLLPQLILPGPDGTLEAQVDTTPLIRRLEVEVAGRSVVPVDPVVAFVDALVEDYADEWLTKAMFHYRWAFAPDIAHAATLLPRWFMVDRPSDIATAGGEQFAARQIGRLAVVGSTPTTAPIIEASYKRLLGILDACLTGSRFLLGARPGCGDFGMYGQLTQLAGFDPTPRALALEIAPRVVAWVDLVEDLSGVEPRDEHWFDRREVADRLRPLLCEIGRTYVPFLLANADALARGADQVTCTIDGATWTQRPFPYQGKCLGWLRDQWTALGAADRTAAGTMFAGTGCERLFEE